MSSVTLHWRKIMKDKEKNVPALQRKTEFEYYCNIAQYIYIYIYSLKGQIESNI